MERQTWHASSQIVWGGSSLRNMNEVYLPSAFNSAVFSWWWAPPFGNPIRLGSAWPTCPGQVLFVGFFWGFFWFLARPVQKVHKKIWNLIGFVFYWNLPREGVTNIYALSRWTWIQSEYSWAALWFCIVICNQNAELHMALTWKLMKLNDLAKFCFEILGLFKIQEQSKIEGNVA